MNLKRAPDGPSMEQNKYFKEFRDHRDASCFRCSSLFDESKRFNVKKAAKVRKRYMKWEIAIVFLHFSYTLKQFFILEFFFVFRFFIIQNIASFFLFLLPHPTFSLGSLVAPKWFIHYSPYLFMQRIWIR